MPHAIRQGDIPGVQLRCDVVLSQPVTVVWRWLEEPELMARWLAETLEAAGDELILESRVADGSHLRERGVTLVRTEEKLWALAFERLDDGWQAATELRFELSGSEPCTLSVFQCGFERLSLSRCLSVWELYRQRWRGALDRLSEALRQSSD